MKKDTGHYLFLCLIVLPLIIIGIIQVIIGLQIKDTIESTAMLLNTRLRQRLTIMPSRTKSVNLGQEVFVWIPYWDQKQAVASMENHIDRIDYVSLFWYGLRADGSIKPYTGAVEDERVIRFAREHGVPVFMLIANLPDYSEGGDWDDERIDLVIASSEARKRHIDELLALMEQHDFDGINIDYEALRADQRDNFTLFIEELAEELHAREKLLAVALHPKSGEGKQNEKNGSEAQDWIQLAHAADQLHLMTYEQHNSDTGPGPIASVSWAEAVARYAAEQTKESGAKIFLGIPLYGYDWNREKSDDEEGRVSGLTYEQVQKLIEDYPDRLSWSDEHEEPYLNYTIEGEEHEVWFSDVDSVERRIGLSKEFGFAGVAFWRIGAEDERLWELPPLIK